MGSTWTEGAGWPRAGGGRRARGLGPAPLYGAIDLGTNNCRMLVARPAEGGIRVVDSFSRIVRLGEGLSVRPVLGDAAIERAVGALRVCARKLAEDGVSRIRGVATEACRRALNVGAFLDRVRAETGLELEPITAEEECRLALAGCAPLLDPAVPNALVFDIGGGSTELSWVGHANGGAPVVEAMVSLPHGVVTLAERYTRDPMPTEDYAALVDDIDADLGRFDAENGIGRRVAAGTVQMLGTSGTVTTLGGVHLGLARYDRARIDGVTLSFCDIERASARLAAMDCRTRARHPCIGRARADLVVVGCAILAAICRRWPVGRIRIADRGIREGILLAMMTADGATWSPGRARESA